MQRFPIGTLNFTNVFSLFCYLAKVSMTDTAHANPACIILRDLCCEGYFALHVESLANHQVAKFNAKIREIKSQPYS